VALVRMFVIVVLVIPSGCREVDHFELAQPEFPEENGTTQLTYSVLDDRAPAFNPADDSIAYTASGYPPFSLRRGLLLSTSPAGGRVRLVLPQVQPVTDSTPWLTSPAYSADGQQLAFVELLDVEHMPKTCDAGLVCPFRNVSAILSRGVLHVRNVQAAQQRVAIPLTFCCRTHEFRIGEDLETVTVQAHPFQQQFERDSSQVFRPSWSPDGNRLIYSNGLDLYLLDVASGNATVLPNTRDGVWPAWSPDGTRIAFTRLLRGNPETATCTCMSASGGDPFPVGSWQITRYFDGGARVGILTIINPDGSGARNLGLGEAPAWLPDGGSVVVQRLDRLWRIDVETGAAQEIPGTERGYEPAVSRAGRWLVFTRKGSGDNDGVDHNITAVRF
jgi:Tol biopolymer transport system component